MEEQHGEILDQEIQKGTDLPPSETRRLLDDIERTRTAVEERIEMTRLRIQQYESALGSLLALIP